VYVTRSRYAELVRFVRASVGPLDDAGAVVLASDKSYGDRDRFYRARGRYHLFNTSNQWTGRGLKRAQVPVGIWTPLKHQVLLWLPDPAPPR
jgi:hypothetical protein